MKSPLMGFNLKNLDIRRETIQIPWNKYVKEGRVRAGSHLQEKHAAHRNRNQALGQ